MDFYYELMSPPCRGTMLTASAVGVTLSKIHVDLSKGEHLKPEFRAINPQHTIPTLVDGDLTLWESRVISAYLVNKYGRDDSLYPKDPKQRAMVDRMLYFDMGTLYLRVMQYAAPVVFRGARPDPEKLENVYEALGWLNLYLKNSDFVAGPNVTIADHGMVGTTSTMVAAGINIERFPKVSAWLERCKTTMPGYEENEEGAQEIGAMIKAKIAEAK